MTRLACTMTLAGLVLVAPSATQAQTPTTVDQLVALALQRAPQLRAARAAIPMAAGARAQAALRPNPTAVVEERRMSDLQHDLFFGADWPLDLFRRPARIQTAEASLAATRLTVEDEERRLAGAVRLGAGRWLAARRAVDVLNERVAAARRLRELLDARVNEGDAPRIDANIAVVEVGRMQADLTIASADAEAEAIALRALVGLPPDASIALADTLEGLVAPAPAPAPSPAPSPAPAMPAMPEMALAGRPDIREATARVALVDARLNQTRREGRFDVSVQGGYSRARLGFPLKGVDADGMLMPIEDHINTAVIGARVSLPLWNRNQGALEALTAERAGASDTLAARERQARAELDAALLQTRESQKAVEQYAVIRDLARQNVDVIVESYDLGRATLTDVLIEQRRYLDVESGYTALLTRAYEATVALRVARGEAR